MTPAEHDTGPARLASRNDGWTEGDILQALEQGRAIVSAVMVSRQIQGQTEYVLYLRFSWRERYSILKTWGRRSDRSYRDVDRLMELLRNRFHYLGPIHQFVRGDPGLQRLEGIAADDRQDQHHKDQI